MSEGLSRAFVSGKSRKGATINSVHHLYHLERFEKATGRKIGKMKSVVEFGGGYGNMARAVANSGAVEACSIIDLLLFSCVQYVFLCAVAGKERVALCNGPGGEDPVHTLYPLSLMDSAKDLRAERFLSTWALSESTRAAYGMVAGRDWFGAASLLMAYNDKWKPWNDGELPKLLEGGGWRVIIEPISFLPESFYIFATRQVTRARRGGGRPCRASSPMYAPSRPSVGLPALSLRLHRGCREAILF